MHAKFAMDYWCALWFWPIEHADLLPTRQEFFFEMSLILEGGIFSVEPNQQLSLFKDDTIRVHDLRWTADGELDAAQDNKGAASARNRTEAQILPLGARVCGCIR